MRVYGAPRARTRPIRDHPCLQNRRRVPSLHQGPGYDRKTRAIERWARSKTAAERSLKLAHGRPIPDPCGSGSRGCARWLAACHDALERNPVRALGPVSAMAKKAPRSMTVPELRHPRGRTHLREAGAIGRDLPDLVSDMMATGLRIGETTSLSWDAVDLELGTVDVRTAAIRFTGRGLVMKTTKTHACTRTLALPHWCVTMLRRAATAVPADGGMNDRPCFRHPRRLAQPVEYAGRPAPALRQRASTGSRHVFRNTVASVIDQAGLSSRAAAGQLGHATPR